MSYLVVFVCITCKKRKIPLTCQSTKYPQNLEWNFYFVQKWNLKIGFWHNHWRLNLGSSKICAICDHNYFEKVTELSDSSMFVIHFMKWYMYDIYALFLSYPFFLDSLIFSNYILRREIYAQYISSIFFWYLNLL